MQIIDLFPYYKISKEDLRAGTPNGKYQPTRSQKLKNKRLKKQKGKRK
jgi:hypothetical protein